MLGFVRHRLHLYYGDVALHCAWPGTTRQHLERSLWLYNHIIVFFFVVVVFVIFVVIVILYVLHQPLLLMGVLLLSLRMRHTLLPLLPPQIHLQLA